MEANKRLYVFDKKEIILIFVLVLLISTTCFVFGVKVGKGYSLKIQDVTEEDLKRVELLSLKEENNVDDEKALEDIVKNTGLTKEGVGNAENTKVVNVANTKAIENRKNNSVDNTNAEILKTVDLLKENIDSEVLNGPKKMVKKQDESTVNLELKEKSITTSNEKDISGKWTVQLGSHQSREDADAFADGFKVRGYEPIINQVYLGDRGVWFRVSLGLFNSIVEAKNFVVEHQSLFDGQDYVFVQFD